MREHEAAHHHGDGAAPHAAVRREEQRRDVRRALHVQEARHLLQTQKNVSEGRTTTDNGEI